MNATVGVIALTAGGKIPHNQYIQVWLTWWISNLGGIFIFTPALLNWGELIKENIQSFHKNRLNLSLNHLKLG